MQTLIKNTMIKLNFLSLTTLLLALALWSCSEKESSKQKSVTQVKTPSKTKTPVIKTAYIAPPLQEVTIPQKKYIIMAETGGLYKLPSGTELQVPPQAFLDENGNLVKGKVELSYREFRDPIDFFVSGIPMTYQKNGQKFTFESAGMFDISASQHGQPLRINTKHKIGIKMLSKNNAPDFNCYRLDTVSRQWQEVRKNMLVRKVATNLKKPTKPIKPQQMAASDSILTILLKPEQFPEMQMYEGVEFKVLRSLDMSISKGVRIAWSDVEMKATSIPEVYHITFIDEEKRAAYIVKPVFAEKNYKKALQKYRRKFAEYQQQLRKASETKVSRFFQINSFGTWNCDRPIMEKRFKQIMANFQNESGEKIQTNQIYVVSKRYNAMFKFLSHEKIRYEKEGENLIWCITAQGKLAYVWSRNLQDRAATKGKYTFKMHIYPHKITSTSQIKKVLNINRKDS